MANLEQGYQLGQGRIWDLYRKANSRSEALACEAGRVIAAGITHHVRHHKPFPI
jgi:hypothetical protein